MAAWMKELDELLTSLGVVQEESAQPQLKAVPQEMLPDFTIFQRSRTHDGAWYRLDLFGVVPELFVYISDDHCRTRLRIYHVSLAIESSLATHYAALEMFRGSPSFEEVHDTFSYHLLIAVGEVLKALFWQGDVPAMDFPSEIAVQQVTDAPVN